MVPPKCCAGIGKLCSGSGSSAGSCERAFWVRSQTIAVLRSIRGGYESLANIELPPSANRALVAWKKFSEEILGREVLPVSLPGFQPVEEQENLQGAARRAHAFTKALAQAQADAKLQMQKQGGKLLRTQICVAAEAEEEPVALEPIFVRQLPNVELERLLEKLQLEDESWPIAQLLRATVGAFELQPSSWVEAQPPSSGISVRQLRFQMVMPNDVPGFLVYLMSLPESSSCSMVCRLHHSEDKVVLMQEVCTHDVTYGENFRTQETLSFERNAAGGVIFKKFLEVIWVAPLPWTHAPIKAFVESKATSSALAAAEYLVQILEDDSSSVIGCASTLESRRERSMSRLSEQVNYCAIL